MALLGVVFAALLALAGALVVGAGAAAVAGGAPWAAVAAVVVLCVGLPLFIDTRLTRAFRRIEPRAKNTLPQSFALVNAAWVLLMALALPTFTRSALEKHGAWFAPASQRAALQDVTTRLGSHIPRSAPASAFAQPATTSSAKVPAPALPAPAPVASAPAPASAPVERPAIRTPDNADEEDTPAARVFRDRAASVVVIRTRAAIDKESPMAELYEHLGVDVQEGMGSGFIVEKEGVIVTNHHVIEDATSLDVALQDGRHFTEVTVLHDDQQNDLALLSIPVNDLPVVPLATKDIRVGSRAIAIGSPLGLEYTLTEGIVSATRKSEGTQFLQMQTSIAPGSSGGPLFDDKGALIGVNTATQGANLNMAVHVKHVRDLLAAPRSIKALASYARGPEVRSIEPVGGAMDPTTRMNFRDTAALLAQAAQRCIKEVPADAHLTRTFGKGLLAGTRDETNLGEEAATCLSGTTTLLSMKIGLLLAQLSSKDTSAKGVDVRVTGIGQDRGEVRFRFVRQ